MFWRQNCSDANDSLCSVNPGFVVYYFFVRPLPPKLVQKRSLVTKDRVICNAAHPELVDTVFDNVKTLDGQFRTAAEKFGDSPCLGYRRELGIKPIKKFVPIDGKMVEKSFNIVQKERAVRYQTFSEVYAEIRAFGAGLADTGMKFGQRLSLYSETRAEWQKTAQACFAYGFPVVTSYSSLGPEALTFSLRQSKSTHVMTNAKLLPVLFKCLADNQCPSVHVVVYTDAASASVVDPFIAATKGVIKLISYDELVAAGRTSKTQPQRVPQPSDVAVIMYTSGSTGNPKGVVINHHSLIAAGAGAANCVVPPLSSSDTYIAFLPLAHVLELMAECGMLAHGVAVAYSNPQQLTDEFVEDENGKPCGDFQAIRPTISAAVPLLMDRMRKGVLDKVAKSKIGSLIFHTAFAIKRRRYLAGLSSWLLDKVVFSKLHAVLGGRIRVMMSGGAPLNAETQEFMNIVFCVPIGQGYGSTEVFFLIDLALFSPVEFDFGTLNPDLWRWYRDRPGGCVDCQCRSAAVVDANSPGRCA
jgi:long-chain acyl-CoA synthetase